MTILVKNELNEEFTMELSIMEEEQIEDLDEWHKIMGGILDELWSSAMVDAAFRDKYF